MRWAAWMCTTGFLLTLGACAASDGGDGTGLGDSGAISADGQTTRTDPTQGRAPTRLHSAAHGGLAVGSLYSASRRRATDTPHKSPIAATHRHRNAARWRTPRSSGMSRHIT